MLSRISSSSSMMRTTPFRLDIHGLPNQRQFQSKGRAGARLALDGNSSAMLLHDSIADRQAKSCALPRRLRRKKWIVDFLDVFGIDSRARILHEDLNLGIHRVRHDAQLATFGHCISRVHQQIQKDLLELADRKSVV